MEDIQQALDESLVQLNTILGSRYCKPIREEVMKSQKTSSKSSGETKQDDTQLHFLGGKLIPSATTKEDLNSTDLVRWTAIFSYTETWTAAGCSVSGTATGTTVTSLGTVTVTAAAAATIALCAITCPSNEGVFAIVFTCNANKFDTNGIGPFPSFNTIVVVLTNNKIRIKQCCSTVFLILLLFLLRFLHCISLLILLQLFVL